MSIIIGADLVPTEKNIEKFIKSDVSFFDEELRKTFREANFRVINLECPLTNVLKPIFKFGPSLSAPCECINGIKSIGVNLLSLANNHIMDQGPDGLISTMKAAESVGIPYIGVGLDSEKSARPYFWTFNRVKVGFYSLCENEFSTSTRNSPGGNAFDPLASFEQIANVKKHCDFLIVLYHGGKEEYRFPTPYLQKVCRKFVESGANLVVVQHTHCLGCEERFKGSTIVYGQGNLLFDRVHNEYWRTSCLLTVKDDFSIEYIPIIADNGCARLANENEKDVILQEFQARSEKIKDESFVESSFENYIENVKTDYLISLCGKRTFLQKALNRLTKGRYYKALIRKKYSGENLAQLVNYFRTETHKEIMERLLNEQQNCDSSH